MICIVIPANNEEACIEACAPPGQARLSRIGWNVRPAPVAH